MTCQSSWKRATYRGWVGLSVLASVLISVKSVSASSPEQTALPEAIAVDAQENIYVVRDHLIWSGSASGVLRPIGPLKGKLFFPRDLAFDAQGNLYIADSGHHQIQKLENNHVQTVAGAKVRENHSAPALFGDGKKAIRAEFGEPQGIALDAVGNLYIADTDHGLIRKVEASTQIVTRLAAHVTWELPVKITLDTQENVFVLDGASQTRIRKIAAKTGRVTTVLQADPSQARASGAKIVLRLWDGDPESILDFERDRQGNLLILTSSGRILKADLRAGVVTRIAGTGHSGFLGDGGPATQAEFHDPQSFAIGPSGAIYVSDTENARIRRIDPSGIITTIQEFPP